MLSLLGVGLELPTIAYDATGVLTYDHLSSEFKAGAVPTSLIISNPPLVGGNVLAPKDMRLYINVDSTGNAVGGVPGLDDLMVEGNVDVKSAGVVIAHYEGTLLTGEVMQFGYFDEGVGSSADQFDFRFRPTGGALMPYFQGHDIGVVMTSEGSAFAGSFAADFSGAAKGTIGPIELLPPASVAGFVYDDADNDGVRQPGEGGIPGVTVALTGNGDHPFNATVTTGQDGSYLFPGLRPGTYMITETQPDGYLDGKDTIGTPGGTAANDVFGNVVLNAGVGGTENNFGELLPSSLDGYVYEDTNNNGTKDPGEPGILDVEVVLTGTDDLGNLQAFYKTAADGYYSFMNLRPGTYTIRVTHPAGYLDGMDTQGKPGTGKAGNGMITDIDLGAGVAGEDNRFGKLKPASLSGDVYCDANNNGIKDFGEPGITGVTVVLTGTDDLGQSVSLQGTTADDGSYEFDNLRPGTYAISEVQPPAYRDGPESLNSVVYPGTVGTDFIADIGVSAGSGAGSYNFGELKVVVEAGNDATINEGGAFTSSGSFADPGSHTWTAMVDYGDGSGVQTLALSPDKTFALSRVYADNGVYTVTVTVTESDPEADYGSDTATVTVNNVAPTGALGSDSVTYGNNSTVSFSAQHDDSSVDTAAGFHYSLATSVGGLATTYAAAGTSASAPFTFDAGDHSIYGRIFDKDGGFTEYTTTVHVNKADAVVTVSGYTAACDGKAHTATGTATGVKGESLSGLDLSGTTHTDAGNYPADAWSFAGGTNYNNASGTVHDIIDDTPPTVEAGADQIVSKDERVTLTGTFKDNGVDWGETYTTSWAVTDPSGNPAPIEWSDDAPTFVAADYGVYTATFTATDAAGNVGDDSALVIAPYGLGVVPGGGTQLVVVGTNNDDDIDVKVKDGDANTLEIKIRIKTEIGSFKQCSCHQGSFKEVLFRAEVPYPTGLARIIVYGLGGNDRIKVDSGKADVQGWLFGGDGNDDLQGGKGDSVLVGGDGDDILKGGSGRNLLIGGKGSDRLEGKKGEDILIGGYTDFDDDVLALCKIMREWTSSDAFDTRRKQLDGSMTGGENGSIYLIADTMTNTGQTITLGTVHDDDAADVLEGGSGSDWLIMETDKGAGLVRDVAVGVQKGDYITDIG